MEFSNQLTDFVREIYQTDEFIHLHAPVFKSNERKYVIDAIDSTYVSTVGEYVNRFEKHVQEYTGAKFAIATVNGTSALHTALIIAGVQYENEVITQSLSFVATCNAISYCGAVPIFVDVDRSALGMSATSLENFLLQYAEVRNDGLCWNKATNRVIKACVPMHNLGHPVDIYAIKMVCEKYHIKLVEDAAESLGSWYNGKHTGTYGQISAISLNGNKIITSGGGGVVITDNDELALRAKHITTTAKTQHPWLYNHDEIGYNYRMPNINAALACAQMEVLSDYVVKKRKLAATYAQWFSGKEYDFFFEPPNGKSNYWFNAFLVTDPDERDIILEETNRNNIMTRPMWIPLHKLEMYQTCVKYNLVNTKWIEERLINIPSGVI